MFYESNLNLGSFRWQRYNKNSKTNDTLLSNFDTILSKYKIIYFYSQYSYGFLVSNEAYLILGRMYLKKVLL